MADRFYLASFDLLQSQGRQNDYKAAEETLKFRFGANNYWKPLKQFCVIRTDQGAAAIRDALSQRLGGNCNILVVGLKKGYAYKIVNTRRRREAKEMLEQLPSS